MKIFWNHSHALHVMKNLLKIDSAKKFPVFQKTKFCLSKSQSIESIFRSIEKVKFSKPNLLLSSIDVQSMLDRSKLKKFQFLKFLTNLFFSCIIYDKIHVHSIVCCIHLAVLQSYLSLFSCITCILNLKIDWLIFELCTL